MNQESIKEAFQKVKEDIFYLGKEFSGLKLELQELQSELRLISNFIEDIKQKQFQEIPQNNAFLMMKNELYSLKHEIDEKLVNLDSKILQQTFKYPETPTLQQINSNITPTPTDTPTDTPTVPHETRGLISPILPVSTGNRGVPTDKPTDRQTNQHIILSSINSPTDKISQLDRASEILSSLDSLKKEVRFKFKRLTNQEMQVFALLYTLEEAQESVDYKLLSERLNLSESSIRDYIHKLQKKGIPITKEKFNNKRVILHISPDLKKIASLNTILKLREL